MAWKIGVSDKAFLETLKTLSLTMEIFSRNQNHLANQGKEPRNLRGTKAIKRK